MMNQDKYQAIIDECDIHASRLGKAYNHLLPNFPITKEQLENFSDLDLGFLEIFVSRFSKLQDTLGAKLFPLLVSAVYANAEKLTVIDILNRLEKAELLPSVNAWQDMRVFRNHLTHEYPDNPDLMISNLNASLDYVKNLLDYWSALKPRAIEIKEQSSQKG